MKILLTSFFCLFISTFYAQEEALLLHEASKSMLSRMPLQVIDRLEALEKVQNSQKLLQDSTSIYTSLSTQNDSLIQDLQQFFAAYENPDSLLELTRFFPDSIFQVDKRYDRVFKELVEEYLAERSKSVRKAFLNFRYLNYNSSYKLNFDKYWPLEVLQFEQWLEKQEKTLQSFPSNARKSLLYSELKQKLDSLKYNELGKNYRQNTDRLLENLSQFELEQESLINKNKNLKYLGLILLLSLLAIGYFFWRKTTRLLENKHQSLLEEKKRSEDLLSNMLPSEVVRQLKSNKVVKAQSYESICILFTDFQSFSKISENLPPEELVRELDYCFSNFDQIIEKYHLQKIKTIGDAYMCVGGLYTKGTKHIQRMVAAALEIQDFLKHRSMQKDELGGYFFEARVGVHTGPVVAGVIGTKRIAFDVWGDSVNIAQQMEQHCEVRTVNISSATYELVKNHFDCTYRGEIRVKNGKNYGMYRVEQRKA